MDSNQWQSFLKQCLDILRNGNSKYDGLKAINEFINLITLKLVENRIGDFNNETDGIINIGLDCKFSYLYDNFCDIKKYGYKNAKGLYDLLYNYERVWVFEDEIDDNLNHISQIKKRNNKLDCIIYRFNNFKSKISKITENIIDYKNITTFNSNHCYDVLNLVIKIHETFGTIDISTFKYDAFGEAYEKMIADELGSGSKRFGQFFTKRDLIKLIINELDIKKNDICYDPACGTGGFLLGFAQYSKKFKNYKDFIENNIYGQEYLPEVYKTLSFNMLANNYDKALNNISLGDSISDNSYHTKILNKFDIIAANPPFGVSINTRPEIYPIQVKNSVALFLQHIYYSLKDGGKAGVIIDRGILNNGSDKKTSWETKLRKFLLEKTNIYKIINLPTGIFKHTNFATSVIFFIKGNPTKSTKYIEGYFKEDDKGKGDKTLYLNEGKILNINEIKNNNYSLKYDDYFKEKIESDIDDKYVKLGDICKILPKSKHQASDAKIDGQYNYYTSSSIIKKSNFNDYKDECLIIGSGGNGSLFIDKNFSCSADNFILKSDTNKYIYYYLKINFCTLYKLYKGNGLKHLSSTDLKKFMIPNLSLDHQNEIVEFLDDIYKNIKIEDTIKYFKDKPIFNLLIEKNYNGFKDIIYFQERVPVLIQELERVPVLIQELERVPVNKNLMIRSIFNKYKPKSEIMKLGDIVKFDIGGTPSRKETKYFNGNHLWVSVSELNNNIINNTKEKITDLGIEHSSVKLIKKGSILLSFKLSIGKMGIAGCDMYCNEAIAFFKHDNKIINKYLYYWFLYNDISKYASGQIGIGSLNKTSLFNIKIPLPSLDIQQEIINKIEKLNESNSHYESYSNILKVEINNIMEIINNMTILTNNKQLNKEESDKEEFDKEESDKEESDKEESNKEESDKEESDKDANDSDNEIQEIEYKNKLYHLIDNKIYNIVNGKTGELFGEYINGKIKK